MKKALILLALTFTSNAFADQAMNFKCSDRFKVAISEISESDTFSVTVRRRGFTLVKEFVVTNGNIDSIQEITTNMSFLAGENQNQEITVTTGLIPTWYNPYKYKKRTSFIFDGIENLDRVTGCKLQQ